MDSTHQIAPHCDWGGIVSYSIGKCCLCIFNVSDRCQCIEIRIVSPTEQRCTTLVNTFAIHPLLEIEEADGHSEEPRPYDSTAVTRGDSAV